MSKSESESAEILWKSLPNSIDYFGPAIQKIQEYTGVDTSTLLGKMGMTLGSKFADMNASMSFEDFLEELVKLWEKSGIGSLNIESTKPLVFSTNNCVVCGQLPEGGGQFRCAIHEGFFEAAIGGKLGRPIKLKQKAEFRAEAGTWSRAYTVEE